MKATHPTPYADVNTVLLEILSGVQTILGSRFIDMLHSWLAPMIDDPAPLKTRGYQSYIVLTLCRMLYTLEFGTVVSKPVAARWARETLGERWAPLIEHATVGRQHPRLEAEADDVNATLDFVRYTIERSQLVRDT